MNHDSNKESQSNLRDSQVVCSGEQSHHFDSSLEFSTTKANNHSQGVLVLLRDSCKVIFANPVLSNIIGYNLGEIATFSKEQLISLIHPDDRNVVIQLAEKVSNNLAGPFCRPIRIRRRNGVGRSVTINATPVVYFERLATLYTVIDISEWKLDSQELVENHTQKEEILRNIADSTPMGMHMYELQSDNRLVFIGANRAADELLNLDHDQFVGMTIEEAFPSSIGTELPEQYRKTAIEGKKWSAEQIEYKDDKIQGAFEVHAFQTSPSRMVACFLDITSRKRADEELRASEKSHRTLVESMRDLVFVLDEDNRFRDIFTPKNHSFFVTPEEFLGKRIDEVMHLNIAQDFIDEARNVRTNGKSHDFDFSFEVDSEFRWYTSSLSLHEDGISIVSVVRDITDRKIAEDKIEQQLSFLEKVLESLAHPFYVIDAEDYTVKLANKAAEFGSISGKETCFTLTHHLDRPCNGSEHSCPLQKVKTTGKPVTVEHTHYNEFGVPKYVEIHAYPVFDSEGKITQMIEYDLDVTEQKWIEKQLETESKRSRLYVDLLAHDIANQLQILWGSVEVLKEILDMPEEKDMQSRLFRQVEESMRKCKDVISKARSSDQLVISPLVERSLARVLIECANTLVEKHDDFMIYITLEEYDAIILADKFLEQLFENLLSNAIEHNPKSRKKVWLKLQKHEDGYQVSVGDNGPGISDDAKEVLFNPSHRIGGLGIHLSTEIVEKYGGQIKVLDRIHAKPSLGTEFLVWLPTLRSSSS